MKPHVFISHSSVDTWVARQISAHAGLCGAGTFLDEADIQHGDDFDQAILQAARLSTELVVLLTPWSINRPYIWIEIGLFWSAQKRIVGVLHGLTSKDISTDERIPALLKKIDLVNLNDIDSYFLQLRQRVLAWEHAHG
ncbi:MAG: TIR domain-containing protein [Candidatus Tectomicrobia bacterium]|uniref:TIR domain-containing protein n=1 Tax=Tectimicrobiota bacterium TaxID=2528274 RepID=A0A937W3F8_UNCTE|nr:TIR domain-containing protein [Candidatus Tectomicrobia bacterium]